jgi:KDO2-lipid IV(A) lauroyltransferase
VVDFFGHPAGTFRSLAILALSTGAPVVPAASWREPNGHHVLRFEEPLAVIESPT